MTSITLRRATPEDAESVHGWRCEPSTSAFQPTLALTLEQVREQLAERAREPVSPHSCGTFQWLALAASGPVGWVSLKIHAEDRAHGKAEVGYTIGEAYRGKGLGRAAVAALVPLAFDRTRFDLERLEAVAAVKNVASRRVLETNGFRFEGFLRGYLMIHGERVDHAMYGLLRSDMEV